MPPRRRDSEGKEKLTPREEAFVEHYLRTWSPTEAAKLAGYSARSAQAIGTETLARPLVQARLQERMEKLQMDADEMLARLANIARGNLADLLDERGNISLTKAKKSGLLSIARKVTRKDGDLQVELYSAMDALVTLMKVKGMFVDKIAPTDPTGTREYTGLTPEERALRLEAILAAARQRASAAPAPGAGEEQEDES